ncbi:hypothetical protein PGB90_002312 [Kerria lacca]
MEPLQVYKTKRPQGQKSSVARSGVTPKYYQTVYLYINLNTSARSVAHRGGAVTKYEPTNVFFSKK